MQTITVGTNNIEKLAYFVLVDQYWEGRHHHEHEDRDRSRRRRRRKFREEQEEEAASSARLAPMGTGCRTAVTGKKLAR